MPRKIHCSLPVSEETKCAGVPCPTGQFKTAERTSAGLTELFTIDIGLHQGSALSPFLWFWTQLTEGFRKSEQGELLYIFMDDLVVIAESDLGSKGKKELRSMA